MITPQFTAVGLFLKHEGETTNGAIGPLLFEGPAGETSAYEKDERNRTKWFNYREALKIAKKLKMPIEVC